MFYMQLVCRWRHAGFPALLFAAPLLMSAEPAAAVPAWQERLERAAATPETWRARAAEIRLHILVSAGLWPPFDRPPLEPVVFHRIERDGYTVEKVHFETWPGFHLTGNLYRPRGKTGPFPAVISPHGHWEAGRFNDTADGSVPGRAITFARLGFVVFSYDMVGFGDLKQLPHKFGEPLWGLSLLGLQLWNSLRAVDFLASLPDVDPARIGATGESGGGTQTFLLTAVDDRIACSAPVCMVAAEFQGGCLCENAPLLRIDLNNVEIAAAAAPRPLFLVSATGDWTKDNPVLEAPAIRGVYEKLRVPGQFGWVQFKADHNYNKDSREPVYAWFVQHLSDGRGLKERPDAGVKIIPEPPFEVEKREDLAVFGPGHELPTGAVDSPGLASFLKRKIRDQLDALRPRDQASLKRFLDLMGPVLEHTLGARWPDPAAIGVAASRDSVILSLPDDPGTDHPLLVKATPVETRPRRATLIVSPPNDPESRLLSERLAENGDLAAVLQLNAYRRRETPVRAGEDNSDRFPATYYRSALAWRVRDILAALAYLAGRKDVRGVRLVGLGEAGIPALLARALAPEKAGIEKTVVDVMGLDDGDETSWTGDRAHPGIMRIGGLRTAGILAAAGTGDLVIHDTSGRFASAWIRDAFRIAGRENAFVVSDKAWTADGILEALR